MYGLYRNEKMVDFSYDFVFCPQGQYLKNIGDTFC